MKGWLFVLFFGVCGAGDVFANPGMSLAESFHREVVALDWTRFLQTSERVRLALPSHLEDWGVINQEAAASYNGWINTIILKPEAMGRDEQGRFRLPTVSEVRAKNNGNLIPMLPTIVHEMAHAEFDFFVEEKSTPQDAWLWDSLRNEIAPAIQALNPHRFSVSVALSELFAYFRGDFLSLLLEDWDEQLFLNGFNRHQNRCVHTVALKKLAAEVSLEEFLTVVPMGGNLDAPYREKARLTDIWVKGKDVSVKGLAPHLWDKLWAHLQHFQRPPRSKRELAERMAKTPWIASRVADCRRELWQTINR